MTQSVETAATPPRVLQRRFGIAWTLDRRNQAAFVVATLAAWAHTIDEIRIGEFIAVPFGIANAALVAAWPRLRSAWQAAASISFGLFWGLAVIPYHVVPLLEGQATGQNISGLSRLIAGAVMVGLGVAIAARRRQSHSIPDVR